MPDEQRQMGYMMMVISPIMIIWISLSSASALGLYWSVSAAFLVVQTHFANIYYEKVAKKKYSLSLKRMKESTTAAAIKGKNTQVVSKRKEITLASPNNVLKVEDNFNFIGRTLFSLQ